MTTPTFISMLRVKNEARWLSRVLIPLVRLCSRVYVFDDHSTDSTREIILSTPNTTYLPSPFTGLDERRDKNYLLDRIYEGLSIETLECGVWVLCIDGDEEMEETGPERIKVQLDPKELAYTFRVVYLWDSPELERIDGIYGHLTRPSMFRLDRSGLKFANSLIQGNLHCMSVPEGFVGKSKPMDVRLYHYGYMLAEDRKRKYEFYNSVDPGNRMEDGYRHVIQGDKGGVGAGERLQWAGPLKVQKLEKR